MLHIKKYTRGFTLIELLVVIAIIGILASVVLASLNSARDKGADAAVKANVNNARSQAELYYDGNANSYLNVCTNTSIANIINGAKSAAGVTTATGINAAGATGTATCNHVAASYAIQVPLKTSGFYCVDSTGRATSSASNLLANGTDYLCS